MIEPILDNLLLKAIDDNEVSKSGIYRPESSKEKPSIGQILDVGPKVESNYTYHETNGKDVFKKAVYKKWQATEVKYDGETYILVAEKDVLAVIK